MKAPIKTVNVLKASFMASARIRPGRLDMVSPMS